MAKRRRNPDWVPSRYGGDDTKRRRRAKSASKARRQHRNKLGHFVKASPRRRPAARRKPATVKRRRTKPRYTPAYTRRAQRRKGVRKHLRAIRPISTRSRVAGLVRLNPRTGAIVMSRALVANPRRRRKNPRRRAAARRRNPRRARRRRNPSFGGVIATVKSSAAPMVIGGLAGMGAGFMDAKLLGTRPVVSILLKLLGALAGAAALGRRHPLAAAGWAGGLIGSTGYHAGVQMGGGMVALSPQAALKGIADMAADDPEMANLIAGLGDVVDDGLGDVAQDYNETLADNDDDGMGDVVEAYQ